jgi:hypothetical protein
MTFTGYIYKLTGACGKVYIGSTNDFDNRISQHNSKYNNCNSKLLLKPILDEVIDTRQYILIKSLRLVEQFYLDTINNINSKRAYTNYKKYQKKYREENKEKIKELGKQWREENKEKKKEKDKKFYEENREKIREKQNEKIKCECGCVVNKSQLKRHRKTKKHIKLIRI